MSDEPRFRIGEFSRRVGISVELLRAWERRYGIPAPTRTDTGLRLYGETERRAVDDMRAGIAAGLSPAEAARMVRRQEPNGHPASSGALDAAAERLRLALDAYREAPAQVELDRLFARFSVEIVVARVILPFLRQLGDRWACGEATVGQEHFASAVVHGRLAALARGWDAGAGPGALLACAPGERHTLGMLCFALLLRGQGWRITYLGGDVPLESLAAAAEAVAPDAIVVSSVDPARLDAAAPGLRSLRNGRRLAVGGAGAIDATAAASGAQLLDQDPAQAARALTEGLVTGVGVG